MLKCIFLIAALWGDFIKKRLIVLILLLVLSLMVSGCSDKKEQTVTIEGENGEVAQYTTVEDADENCPVGTTWSQTNPSTGEMVTMEVVGTETIDGRKMCHASYTANTEDSSGMVRMEYYWTTDENEEVVMWISYDRDGNVISEMKSVNGMVTMTDENGNTMEFGTNS